MKTKKLKLIAKIKAEVIADLLTGNYLSNTDDSERPMSAVEICDHYGIHISTLNRYVVQGLKFQTKGKNCRRFFTKKDFNDFTIKNKRRWTN